jgi:hypothetical protein
MSVDIDLNIYNYERLKKRIISTYNLKPEDERLLESILSKFGVVVGDRYIILDNELYEDGNPYYNVSFAIEKAFKLGDDADVFGRCFCPYDLIGDNDYKQCGINYAEVYDVLYELGIEYDDDYDDEYDE